MLVAIVTALVSVHWNVRISSHKAFRELGVSEIILPRGRAYLMMHTYKM